MQIVVLRHGRDQPGPGKERVLSAYGKATVEAKGAEIEALLKGPVRKLWCSPATRARESAEALVGSFSTPSPPTLEIDPALAEDEGLRGIQEALQRAMGNGETAVLVGHNPAISELFYELSGEGNGSETSEIVIQNGEAVLIEFGPDREVVEAVRV